MAKRAATTCPLDATTRVAVLHGKDAFLRGEYTAGLRRALEEGGDGLDVLSFDGATTRPAEVLDECRSFGLMARHKLVIVDNAEVFVKEEARPLLERYCQAPSESATLVLRAERWFKGKLDDMVGRVGAVVKCEPQSAAGACEWVIGHARQEHGAGLDRATAQRLIDRAGTDAGRLASEVGKLAVAAGKGKAITAVLIDELVGDTREDDAWGFQDTLVGGNPEQILAGLSRLLDNAPRDTAVLVTIVMIETAKKLHALGDASASGQNPRSLAGKFKIWPPDRIGPMVDRATGARPGALRGLYHAAVDADVRQKSGLGRSHRTLERLALKFAAL